MASSIGFSSTYLTAEKGVVITKFSNDGMYEWESSAWGFFTVCADRSESVGAGIKMIPCLKVQIQYLMERWSKEV